ncbi:unnamed protein product [Vitrella brassicaformis CCMP3155]|uniref:Uncharacterized protein n=1 Tax=Vitrella brassicaformis (strain CCMP3155) TaxID=1169540 RepID=A0A0G4G2S1_VITBC|nr:unnamed protein product [Vitrella brassicaformis CCMP3155]|eukprot:CEM22564.1 unnamed protein product [Vitrella brassicaformis CCMP3155]
MCQVGSYSSGQNEDFLSGGVGSGGRVPGDVWRLRVDGTEAAWEEMATSDDDCGRPGAVHAHTSAFDEPTDRVRFFGGTYWTRRCASLHCGVRLVGQCPPTAAAQLTCKFRGTHTCAAHRRRLLSCCDTGPPLLAPPCASQGGPQVFTSLTRRQQRKR